MVHHNLVPRAFSFKVGGKTENGKALGTKLGSSLHEHRAQINERSLVMRQPTRSLAKIND